MSAEFILDRCEAIPALIGNHRDFLIIAGLAGTAKDTAALTEDGDHLFALAGAMGGACMIGLGLALAQPEKKILVVTGDGELLMNIGCLASIALVNPANLSILCVDNGHYGETGYQRSHTSFDTNLELMAQGAGLTATRTVSTQEQIPDGARLLREANGSSFVVARVKPTPPPKVRRNMDPSACRHRFRAALLAET